MNYKRGTLVGTALLLLSLGVVGFLIALSPLEGRRGILGLLVMILGPAGAKITVAAAAILISIGALRLIWLTFDGALAVQIGARGIHVRSVYYTGSLPWSSVRAVNSRVVTGWGKHCVLVIYRKDEAGLLLRLVGLGDKIVVQRKLLDTDDKAFESWIATARRREGSLQINNTAHPVASPQRVFGRRQ